MVGGRRLARLAADAFLAAAVALSAAALGVPEAVAAEASTITATPSPIPAGQTLAVTGTVFGWRPACEIVIDTDPVPSSTCSVADDALTGTLTIPSNYVAGTYVITACSSSCPSPNAVVQTFTAARPSPLLVSTTVTVEPAVAPPPPQLVAVPPVVGMTMAAALAALRGADLIAGYGSVPPNAHVSAEQPAAGALVAVGSRVPLTLLSWVRVPDLAKLTLRQAVATAGTGLVVQSKSDKGRVKSQVPLAGVVVPPATVIAVTLVADSTNYVRIAVAGGVAIVLLIAALVATRAFRRRRRRLARRWYYDHVRLTSRPGVEAGFDSSSVLSPSVRLAVRDTRLQTCELEEADAR